jgi:RNA polymerase sigma factor (sigma-70 family)
MTTTLSGGQPPHTLSSFLSALVQANLAPVLESEEVRTEIVTALHPAIERAAYSIYYRVRCHVSVEPGDLIQEGMLAAWKATGFLDADRLKDTGSLPGFIMKHARGAMFKAITKGQRRAVSLEEYLDHPWTQEIADSPPSYHQTSYAERRRILAALRQLSETERLIIMAIYRIEDAHNQRVRTLENIKKQLQMSESGFYKAKHRALKKLAEVLEGSNA